MIVNKLATRVLGLAIEVHKELGPGLLESTYEKCLAYELTANKIEFKQQYPICVRYKGIQLDCGYRVDFLVENQLILELKSVDELHPVHDAQLLTYMRLAHVRHGFLLNFNVELLKYGMKSFIL